MSDAAGLKLDRLTLDAEGALESDEVSGVDMSGEVVEEVSALVEDPSVTESVGVGCELAESIAESLDASVDSG